MLAQVLPAIDVVVLQLLETGCVIRHPLRKAGFKHERHGIGQLHRLELAAARVFKGGRINETQVSRLRDKFCSLRDEVVKIVVTHHPFDLPDGVREERLLGRATMAMAKLSTAGADLFLAGHLHVSHIGHSAERYQVAGHSALVVQAGTVSTRSRGEQPSFNVLRIQRPEISVARMVWDQSASAFLETAESQYRHTEVGWIKTD